MKKWPFNAYTVDCIGNRLRRVMETFDLSSEGLQSHEFSLFNTHKFLCYDIVNLIAPTDEQKRRAFRRYGMALSLSVWVGE